MAVRKTKAGLALKRWFKEDWKDVRTGKKCGRKKLLFTAATSLGVVLFGVLIF